MQGAGSPEISLLATLLQMVHPPTGQGH